ncbi:MAG: lipid-transfer protein [Actinobacteria bacterium]|nr:lipid-transfer protein [Actinomycetota bacterium]
MEKSYVVGVGMTTFDKPGTKDGDYPEWVEAAAGEALADAGLHYGLIEEAYAGYCYGDSTSGERAIYSLGLTGIPIVNVNNNCSTGSTALYLARRSILAGFADCVLAVGFEKMERGSIGMKFPDRTQPLDRHIAAIAELQEWKADGPMAPMMFGAAGREHMQRYGSTAADFAWVGWKNHKHSVANPYAQFQDEYTQEQIEGSPEIYQPLTRLQCSPTSDGAAAAVLASERFVEERGLWSQAIELAGQALVTDTPGTFESRSAISLVGSDMTEAAGRRAMEEAGIDIGDVDVIELHDCFSTNEVLTYEALGLAEKGHGHDLVRAKATTFGGDGPVVNPSGGLISKGHPLGATGLAQCAELNWHLRGLAGERQVEGAEVALQHNIGLGGAAVVGVYKKASQA